jgi:hypothetical protein
MYKPQAYKKIQNWRSKAKSAIVNAGAAALSKPARMRGDYISRKSEIDYQALKSGMSKEAQRAPQFDTKGNPSSGFMARSQVDKVKARVQKNTNKLTKPGKVRKAVNKALTLNTKKYTNRRK